MPKKISEKDEQHNSIFKTLQFVCVYALTVWFFKQSENKIFDDIISFISIIKMDMKFIGLHFIYFISTASYKFMQLLLITEEDVLKYYGGNRG